MNLPDPNDDWLEAVAGRRPTPAEAEGLRRRLATRPRERARLAGELALNAALDGLPAPPTATNFSARVWAEIARGERVSRRLSLWASLRVRFHPARFAALAVLVLAAVSGGWQFQRHQRFDLAASVAEVARAVPEVETLNDFEAILALRSAPQPGDVETMNALAQQ